MTADPLDAALDAATCYSRLCTCRTKGRKMSEVTDGDRARDLLFPELATEMPHNLARLQFSDEAQGQMDRIAAALADERERARAPFLELAEVLEAEGLKEEEQAKKLGASATAESWWGSGAASLDAATRIRRAAEETE